MPGTEVFLAPHDPDFDPDRPSEAVLSIDALCVNRDLPTDLPFGGGHPRLRLVEGAAAVAGAERGHRATPTLRPPLREAGFWRLVSHLSLGHLSVTGGAEGAAALKEVLRLYDLRDTAETRAAIEALIGVSAGPGTARAPGRAGGFCRGLDVTLEFDPRSWQAGGLYLLAAVLEHFLALHGTVNSFTRTRVRCAAAPAPPPPGPPAAAPGAGVIAGKGMRGRSALGRLGTEPRRFRFDAAVRVLTTARRQQDPADAVRFRSPAGLVYPPPTCSMCASRPMRRPR